MAANFSDSTQQTISTGRNFKLYASQNRLASTNQCLDHPQDLTSPNEDFPPGNDPVRTLWSTFRTDAPLCTPYNAFQPKYPLAGDQLLNLCGRRPSGWAQLTTNVVLHIHDLYQSARNRLIGNYILQTTCIVEDIRVMLHAAGPMEMDACLTGGHNVLRVHHGNIMAALAKLVVSAKLAAGVCPPPDAHQCLQAHASEELLAVGQFLAAAQDARIDVRAGIATSGEAEAHPNTASRISSNSPQQQQKKSLQPPTLQYNFPRRTSRTAALGIATNVQPRAGPTQRIPASGSLSLSQQSPSGSNDLSNAGNVPNFLAQLDIHLESIFEATGSLARHVQLQHTSSTDLYGNLRKPDPLSTQTLISKTRATVKEVGDLLALVEDLGANSTSPTSPIRSLNKPLQPIVHKSQQTKDFLFAKQTLCNTITGLVMATEKSTDPLTPSDAFSKLWRAAAMVNESAQELSFATKRLLEERGEREREILQGNVLRFDARTGTGFLGEGGNNGGRTRITEDSAGGDSRRAFAQEQQGIDTELLDIQPRPCLGNDIPNSGITSTNPTFPMLPDMTGELSAAEMSAVPPCVSLRKILGRSTHSKEVRYNEKFRRFFGENSSSVSDHFTPPPVSTAVTPPSPETPWFLNYDYSPDDIVFNPEGHVKGGTLECLLERLTLHDALDSNFTATFLLTYRSFTTSEELFELLVRRFMIAPPGNLDKEDMKSWIERKQTPIRLRVFNILKSWLEHYYFDNDKRDHNMLYEIRAFAATTGHENMPFAAAHLINVIEKQLSSEGTPRRIVLNKPTNAPSPILPRNRNKIKFMYTDALEVARQLTILESRLFCRIQPVECLNKAWSDKESPDRAPNIKAMIESSNQLMGWCAGSILAEKDLRKRAAMIKHFVAIAEKCHELNNFNSLMAILAGLGSAPIHRLKRTWELVNSKSIATLEVLRKVMNPTKNSSEYREGLHSVNPPCVPFLGVYLTDLTFIEDGNPATLHGATHLINFSKRSKTAEVIREIQQYQSVAYCLAVVPEFQDYLNQNFSKSKDVQNLYERSLEMEPRQRDDERMTRLLHESGSL